VPTGAVTLHDRSVGETQRTVLPANRRRRTAAELCAFGVAVALVVVTALVVRSPTVARTTPPTGDTGSIPTAVVRHDVAQFVTLSADGRTITAWPISDSCGDPLPNRMTVAATGSRVALTMLVTEPVYSASNPAPTVCALAAFFSPLVRVRLAHPLGSRALVQGLTGGAIPWFGGAQLATAEVLPTWCVPGLLAPAGDDPSGTAPAPSGSHPGATWTCPPQPLPGPAALSGARSLSFSQWVGRIGSLGLPVERRVTVHGEPALIKVDDVGQGNAVVRSISWHAQGYSLMVTSDYHGPWASVRAHSVLSDAQLVAIASGVVVP